MDDLEVEDGGAWFKPTGTMTSASFVLRVKEVMLRAVDSGARRLLLDTTRVTTFEPLSLQDRYHVGSGLATFWDSRISLAFLCREDQVNRQRFGETVARSRGLEWLVFTEETPALEWLRPGPPQV